MPDELSPDQLEVYRLSQYFMKRAKINSLVVLTDNPEVISAQALGGFKPYVIKTNLQVYRRKRTGVALAQGSKMISPAEATPEFLKDKLVIVIDFLEKKYLRYLPFTNRRLRQILGDARFSILSVSAKAAWSRSRLRRAVSKQTLVGKGRRTVGSADKTELIMVGGRDAAARESTNPKFRMLAIMAAFNEIDIIGQTITHLLEQGLDLHIIDNWSNDGSYEKVLAISKAHPGRISVERYPKKNIGKYQWGLLLKRVTEVAESKIGGYDWVMLNDADELRWAPWPHLTLKDAFGFVDSLGYNAVDHTVFDLAPTKDGFDEKDDPSSFFGYGQFSEQPSAFAQIKAWKNFTPADLFETRGHRAKFEGQKLYPLKFLMAHYPLRSEAQANRKIFKDRRPRFVAYERKQRFHNQYDSVKTGQKFIKPTQGLVEYDEDFMSNYLIETLTGTGLKNSSY